MAEGLKSYIARRREEGKPLQFSNVGPGNRPESWDDETGSTYFRPEETWIKETEAELKKPASGFDYSEEVGQRFPTTPKAPQSRGSILNTALGELQKHVPGIVKHTLGGKEAPSTDKEKQAVQQNIKSYFAMILKDVESQANAKSDSITGKEKEFEYYKGLSRADKSAFETIYGNKGKGSGEGGSFAEKEQYKYLVGKLKALDEKLTGEFSEDMTEEERGKIQNERQTVLDGMMAIEDKMGGKGGMQRASSGSKGDGQPMDKRAAIKQAADAGASKEDILSYIKQNPDASVDDFLTNFGISSKAENLPLDLGQKKKEPSTMPGKLPSSTTMTPLSARSEGEFKDWYKSYADKSGLNPDPDAPEHYYDYRAAFLQGAEPDEEGHWPSEFKLEGHPRMIVDGMNTKTGQPVEAPDIKNTPINKTQQSSSGFSDFMGFGSPETPGGLQRKAVPYYNKMGEPPTKEQTQAAHQELADLASKLGVGAEDWKAAGENYRALGQLAKEVGGWAWDAYTNALGILLRGQEEARKGLPAYGGQG